MKQVNFKEMAQGSAEDFKILEQWETEFGKKVIVDSIIQELKKLDVESPYPITRYQHSLQSATRAYRDGADEELIVAALLHDIGDTLAMKNHTEMAAAILRPYVSKKVAWIIQHHGLFQGYYFWHHLGKDRNARDKYKDHPWYDDCVHFCEHYDQVAFDKEYDTLDLDFFMPMVERIFSREPHIAE